eukprot:7143046-Prymnesium_polylepis.2
MCKADGQVQPVTEEWQLESLGGEAAAVITAGAALAPGEQVCPASLCWECPSRTNTHTATLTLVD